MTISPISVIIRDVFIALSCQNLKTGCFKYNFIVSLVFIVMLPNRRSKNPSLNNEIETTTTVHSF
jgi:hypothetical protein